MATTRALPLAPTVAGNWTRGRPGFMVNYGQDMEWDFEDDLLYWAAFNADAFEAQ